MKIFVGNISADASDDDLKQAAEALGAVTAVGINREESGESKGFGFIDAADKAAAEAIIAGLNDKELKGQALRVNAARAEKPVRGGQGPRAWNGLGGKQPAGETAGKRLKKGGGKAGYNGGRVGSGEG